MTDPASRSAAPAAPDATAAPHHVLDTEPAPAKVNLSLRIVGRRADGYHLLDSLVGFTDFGDDVSLLAPAVDAAPAPATPIRVTGTFADALKAELSAGASLSIADAARLLAARDARIAEAAFALRKELPIAAGIGGGTADAAATLRMVNRAYGLALSRDQLAAMGLALGADVPACIHSVPLRMQGVGETITRLASWPDLPVVLVNPRAPAPTPAVFQAYREAGSPVSAVDAPPPATTNPQQALAYIAATGNDLTAAASAVQPAIADALALAAAAPGAHLARMSGSGATVFALFGAIQDAEAAARAIVHAKPTWWARAGVLRGC